MLPDALRLRLPTASRMAVVGEAYRRRGAQETLADECMALSELSAPVASEHYTPERDPMPVLPAVDASRHA